MSTLFPSPAPYDDATRSALVDAFAALTLDAMALQSAVYLAHRACRGPLTAALHPLLGAFPPALSDGAALLDALLPMVRAFLLQCHGVAATANEQGATEALDLVTRVIAGTQFYGWQIAAMLVPGDESAGPASTPRPPVKGS